MRKGTKGMLGEKLMTLRKKSGYSQQELADRLKVSRQIISNWELNQGAPSIDKAKELVGKMVKLECSDIDLALEEGNDFFSIGKVKVLEVDGEWLRVEYQRTKEKSIFQKEKVVKLIELSAVEAFEVLEEKEVL
ncbi:putative transcriptional regulator [Blautia hydrogenotrophica]|uniref:helix-turn-helix transcriptional regulator n=1 Tax=Blautia hydrogenotrophica TaxID=53443 RepID=UPI0006C57CF9|nr:helix-turn-helix domain-containing protein [Blautia hydrogenotrophica]CUM91499.1 putative transcriptional regulator [Blautia hydrogenotrophica]SCH52234.1 putative transcriptional regulator [uncultured Blautia sp.]